MSPLAYQTITMILYLVAMLFIGWYSYRRTHDLGDYMLGGRDLPPAVAALSAGAADMSGWLLMGLPGAIYAAGLVESWIAVGLTVGAWANWKWVAPRLRAYSEVANDSITVPSFFENRLRDPSRAVRMTSAVIILVFFTFYVGSGMSASGVFYESSFGTVTQNGFLSPYHTGLVVISLVTVAYTLFGGFLAVSYTDFIQGVMMVAALIAVPVFGLFAVGGIGEVSDAVRAIDPNHLSMVRGATFVGVVSALAWGLGYFGQPHIITRFMALRNSEEAVAGRRIGIGWMIFSVVGAICTALVGMAYFRQNPELAISDPETVYIRMGQILFHPVIAGFMLAAVLAAIMSTMASQLIVTSSALVEDIYRAFGRHRTDAHNVMMGRIAVLVVSLVAAGVAWDKNSTILRLVAFAWAGFGAAFGPVVLLSLYWRKLTWQGALAGMITGAGIVAVWGPSTTWGGSRKEAFFGLYEMVPGFFLGLLVAVLVSLVTYRQNHEVERDFESMRQLGRQMAAEEKTA